jgi:hypothetical protein
MAREHVVKVQLSGDDLEQLDQPFFVRSAYPDCPAAAKKRRL